MTDMDALILCGGKGTRLKSVVSDRPKPMAALKDRPFLELLLEYAAGFGFRRFILCAGYMASIIEEHFSGRSPAMEILVSAESAPLDTAGAVKNAEALIKSGVFMVMNGDSICKLDLREFAGFHFSRKAKASIAVARVSEAGSFGSIEKDESGKILSFREKSPDGAGWVNAGIYIFDRSVLAAVPPGAKYSIERDLLPEMAAAGGVYAFETSSRLFDIGTPEGYKEAGEKLI